MSNDNPSVVMRKTFAVVMHTGGTGYVVRTVFDGYLPVPYKDAKRIAEYRRESDADRRADKLNGIR